MAANIPAGLKAADVTRFAVRASQLEQAKPVIAYWCECGGLPERKYTSLLTEPFLSDQVIIGS